MTNIDEYLAQSNPGVADSDGDGLSDFSEVREYQTDASLYDTDGDGLGDGTEIINGLEPLIADTDQNGISDGDEAFTQRLIDAEYADLSALNLDVEPRLYITGSGDYSDQIDILVENNNKTFEDLDYIVSEIFEIKHDDDLTFENATIELELSDEVLNSSDISDLKVIRLDYETGSIDILTTQYDAGKKMIYSEVDQLCYYAVVDMGALTNDTDIDNADSVFKSPKADLVFVIDTTGSMGGTINNVKNNIETYVNDLYEQNVDVRLGLVEYKDIYEDSFNSTRSYGFYEDVDSFINAVDSLVPDGGGDLDETAVDALFEARKMEYRAGSNKFIVLLTDAEYKNGIQSDSSYTMEDEIAALTREGFNVSVVSEIEHQTAYQNLYTNTNGIFANLDDDFADVLNPLVEVMDTKVNNSTWVRLSDLSLVNVDMDLDEDDDTDLNEEYEKDSDEDGIPDIIEMGKEVTVNIPIKFNSLGVPTEYKSIRAWSYRSNPYLKDTDGDGFIDSEDPYPKEYNMTVKELCGDNVIELNTGSLYCIFGMDINEFYEMYYTRNLRPLEKGTLEALKRQLEINIDMDYTADEAAFLCNIDIDGIKDYMQYENNSFQDRVYEKLTGTSAETEMAVAFFRIISSKEAWKEYVSDSVDRILFGNYTDNGNLLGTAGELAIAFTGVDFVQDIRDLSHDILFWETNWEHIGETTIDGIGLIPVIGMFAKSDEIFTVCKRSDNLYEIRKVKGLEKIVNTAEGLKYLPKAAEIVNTAKDIMKSYSTYLYWKVLDTLDGVNGYKLAFAGAGIYDNRLINAITNNVEDLKYIEEVNPAKATAVLQDITSNSIGKSADEIDEIVDSSLSLMKQTTQELLNDVLDEYAEKVISKTKVAGTYSEGKAASEILREEMISAGIDINSVAPYPNAAHHIVPAAEIYESAVEARKILERYGFDLNSAANGVLLPYKEWETVVGETIHSGRHTENYCKYVLQELNSADIKSVDDIAVILNNIRELLLKGELKL
ncbi:MAG: AHH domain-containing protein [Anaerocolumna sp.]